MLLQLTRLHAAPLQSLESMCMFPKAGAGNLGEGSLPTLDLGLPIATTPQRRALSTPELPSSMRRAAGKRLAGRRTVLPGRSGRRDGAVVLLGVLAELQQRVPIPVDVGELQQRGPRVPKLEVCAVLVRLLRRLQTSRWLERDGSHTNRRCMSQSNAAKCRVEDGSPAATCAAAAPPPGRSSTAAASARTGRSRSQPGPMS